MFNGIINIILSLQPINKQHRSKKQNLHKSSLCRLMSNFLFFFFTTRVRKPNFLKHTRKVLRTTILSNLLQGVDLIT